MNKFKIGDIDSQVMSKFIDRSTGTEFVVIKMQRSHEPSYFKVLSSGELNLFNIKINDIVVPI